MELVTPYITGYGPLKFKHLKKKSLPSASQHLKSCLTKEIKMNFTYPELLISITTLTS